MSIRQMTLVWELDVSPTEKLLLLALADHGDDRGRSIYPSVPYLSRKTGLAERSIRRLLSKYRSEKVLVLVREAYRHQARHYRLDVSKLPTRQLSFRDDSESPLNGFRDDSESVRDDSESVRDDSQAIRPDSESSKPSLNIINHPLEPLASKTNGVAYDAAFKKLKDYLQAELQKAAYDNWVRDTRFLTFDDDENTFVIATVNAYNAEWCNERLSTTARKFIAGILNKDVNVRWEVSYS